MYKTIIVDDEPKSISSIEYVIKKKCPQLKILDTARSADEAHIKINTSSPDIVFLDVDMPYGSGFDLLERIKNYSFEVIFVTAYENFAVKAFKTDATDYILKPFTEDDITYAVKKAVHRVQQKRLADHHVNLPGIKIQRKGKIAVPMFDGLVFLNINEIVRCEASENYTEFFLKDKRKLLVCKTISEYEELLTPHDFHRIHQSHLVNLAFVQKYVKGRGGYVVMQDGTHVDVSARKKMEFLGNIFR